MAIEIPDNLEAAIFTGLSRGRQKSRQRAIGQYAISVAVIMIFVMTSLTVTVNVSPTFAEALSDIPILGRIVEVLTFVEGQSTGGKRTDGTDISGLEIVESGTLERFVIHFDQTPSLEDDLSSYTIHHDRHPNIVQFDIGGARMISAREDFESIRKLSRVQDVYTLMTLDDSLIRFQVVLAENVELEIARTNEPAGLLVTLNPQTGNEENTHMIYSVRSKSFPKSESFGHLEEELFWGQNDGLITAYRIIKDETGQYLYELGQFDTEDEAEAELERLQGEFSFDLILELRTAKDLPKTYSYD